MEEKITTTDEEQEFDLEAIEGGFADIISALRADMLAKTTTVSGALGTGTGAGGVITWQNTTGHDCNVRLYLYLTTASTAAATVDAGRAATAVSADNLIDGLDVNAAVGLFTNLTSPGTNGKTGQLVKKNEYVTASQSSGAVAGLAGRYVLELVYLN